MAKTKYAGKTPRKTALSGYVKKKAKKGSKEEGFCSYCQKKTPIQTWQ